MCTMRFLFNYSSASSSPTLPGTQREQVGNKQTVDEYSLKLKIGCLDLPRATELPSSTTASSLSHVCASATPDWCIASNTSSHHYVFSDRPRHKFEAQRSDNADTSTAREVPTIGHQTCGVPDLMDLNFISMVTLVVAITILVVGIVLLLLY